MMQHSICHSLDSERPGAMVSKDKQHICAAGGTRVGTELGDRRVESVNS